MSEFPERAKVVVIGAGIVGNCLVGHLSDLGWTDIVQVDKGPLPNPGGSTGHASNFIFPVDHNKEMALLTLESQRQYEEMGTQTISGGIEVARDEVRLEEFRRRMTSAKAWDIDARLLTLAEIAELVLRVVRDAEGEHITFDKDPLIVIGVGQVLWNVHTELLINSWKGKVASRALRWPRGLEHLPLRDAQSQIDLGECRRARSDPRRGPSCRM